jgi:hypothetical protein
MRRSHLIAIALLMSTAAVFSADDKKADEGSPRMGKYKIFSYGRVSAPPLYLGAVVLEEGGTYKVLLNGDKPGGEGKYAYDAGKKAIVWKDGPYKDDNFTGEFTIEGEGKTHKIRLKKTTIATNTQE